jgi:hypothetical protein
MVSDIILFDTNSLKLKIYFSEISDIPTVLEFYSSVHGIPAPQTFCGPQRPAQNRPIAAAGT